MVACLLLKAARFYPQPLPSRCRIFQMTGRALESRFRFSPQTDSPRRPKERRGRRNPTYWSSFSSKAPYFLIPASAGERKSKVYICGGGKLLPVCLLLCKNNRPVRPGHCGGRCWVNTQGRKADKIRSDKSRSPGCCQAPG